LKVILAQIAPSLGDAERNLKIHLEEIRRAERAGADLIVFPELSLTGYLLQDLVAECAMEPKTSPLLRRLEKASARVAVVAGFVEQGPGISFYNAAACFVKGKLAHLHRKVYLPTYGMFDEGRYFAQGDVFRTFEAPWGRTGILICEDFWHLSSSWLLAQEGMELLVVATNSPVKEIKAAGAPTGQAAWSRLGQVVAQFLTCYVVCVNRAGGEEGWTFAGGSFAVAPSGKLIGEARQLRADRLAVALPPGPLRQARTTSPLLRDEKLDLVRRELGRIVSSRYKQE